jgi:hypothetical protein
VLEALREDGALTFVTGQHVTRAVDGLLGSSESVTRTLLGVGVDPETLPVDGPAPIPTPAGWFSTPCATSGAATDDMTPPAPNRSAAAGARACRAPAGAAGR